jgi:SynChlorMet cassette radical SAM/SPASM protein ScmE
VTIEAAADLGPLPGIMRTPRSIDVELTARCNLRCTYCYFFDNPAVEYRDLPTDQWLQFFEECGQCGIMTLTLAGGEPFMRRDLRTLLDGIVRNRMRFSILSNGSLIDDNVAGLIGDTGRCDSVQISVDGSGPETHDACRGQGSFNKAVQAIDTLQRNGVPVTVRVTIHRHNVRDLENTARLLLEDLGLRSFATNAAGYLGSCRLNADDVLLTAQERALAMATLLRLSEQYDGRISAQAGPLADARTWRRMEDARRQKAPAFHDGGYLTGCGCSNSRIAVRADGAIVPCNMLAHMELGWINQDSLREVWQHSPALNRLRRRYTIRLTEFDFCAGCPYIPYCTGNCPGLAYSLIDQVDHPSPDACLRRFLQDGGEIASINDRQRESEQVAKILQPLGKAER